MSTLWEARVEPNRCIPQKEAMSERITEDELSESDPDGWYAMWRSALEADRGPVWTAEARFGLRLVAEVRRLRGLILELADAEFWPVAAVDRELLSEDLAKRFDAEA